MLIKKNKKSNEITELQIKIDELQQELANSSVPVSSNLSGDFVSNNV